MTLTIILVIIGSGIVVCMLIIAWSLARVASKVPPIPTVDFNEEENENE
jgi:hypothetical protein